MNVPIWAQYAYFLSVLNLSTHFYWIPVISCWEITRTRISDRQPDGRTMPKQYPLLILSTGDNWGLTKFYHTYAAISNIKFLSYEFVTFLYSDLISDKLNVNMNTYNDANTCQFKVDGNQHWHAPVFADKVLAI